MYKLLILKKVEFQQFFSILNGFKKSIKKNYSLFKAVILFKNYNSNFLAASTTFTPSSKALSLFSSSGT